MNKKTIFTSGILAVLFPIITIAGGKPAEVEKPEIVTPDWNNTQLAFYSSESEKKAIETLPEWISQPLLWPEESEISEHKAAVTEKQKADCIELMSKFVQHNWIPNNTRQYLVPMGNWAKADERWKEKKRKADVFIVNYKINNYLIYMVEGKDNITISIKETNNQKSSIPEDEYTDFVYNMAQKFLTKPVLPTSKNDITWFKKTKKELSSGNWICSSMKVVVDSKGRKAIPAKNAAKIGAMNVRFHTDGKLIQFVILSDFQSVLDPYQQRFLLLKKENKFEN